MQKKANVDAGEIEKFASMAADWWNPFGSSQPLHRINPLRFEFIEKYTPLTGLCVLDIGCGGGILTESLAKAGAVAVGIDMASESIEVAKQHAAESKLTIDYQVIPAEAFADASPEKFDVVTCMELLEHVPDPESLVLAIAKLLKPGGHAFFSTINRNPKSFLYAIVGAEYLLRLLPKGTHHYEKFITPVELSSMIKKADLTLMHMSGFSYHPIFKTCRLTTNVSVNYLVHATKASLENLGN